VVGVERLVALTEPERGRILPGCFYLADDMRLGKSKQVIDAAQMLFTQSAIDTVIVVAPASVFRDVWYDPDLGEIRKHRWEGLPTRVFEYHARIREWAEDLRNGEPALSWIIANFEYIRYQVKRESVGWRGPHLDPLLQSCDRKTWLVLDETTWVKNPTALQTRACQALRKKCGRVTLLNGTPITHSPLDLFSQGNLMDPRILECPYLGTFRSRYAIMGGYQVEVVTKRGVKIKVPTEVIGWRHRHREGCCTFGPNHPVHSLGPGLEDLQRRFAPYILRREKKDCLDIPPKLDPVAVTATLTDSTWRIYREMRDQLCTWLSEQKVAFTPQAGVKVMRLAQICAGFLGGVEEESTCQACAGQGCPGCGNTGVHIEKLPVEEIGREKLDVFLNWAGQRLEEEPEFRMLVWCRFRPELWRLAREATQRYPTVTIRTIQGDQKREDRTEALRLMHPDVSYSGPAILAGTLGTGSLGLNLAGAHEVVYASNDYSLFKRSQSEDRPHGPGQTQPVSYHDIIAVGPKGQKTVDHAIVRALRERSDLAAWTCSAWVTILREE
jgi:hypothetical protein